MGSEFSYNLQRLSHHHVWYFEWNVVASHHNPLFMHF